MTKTQIKTISFAEIVEYAKTKMQDKSVNHPIVSYKDYYMGYSSPIESVVLLNFTLYGDYCGSTVEKSNYYVLKERLKELYRDRLNVQPYPALIDDWTFTLEDFDEHFHIFELNYYNRYAPGYSTEAIAIIGDLPIEDWQLIKDAVDSVEQYPVLDDMQWSDVQSDDCWDSWISWQYDDIARELEDRYSIDLESDRFEEIYAKDNNDKYGWLWSVINDVDICPSVDTIETLEINACAYYSFDPDDDTLMDELHEYLLTVSV